MNKLSVLVILTSITNNKHACGVGGLGRLADRKGRTIDAIASMQIAYGDSRAHNPEQFYKDIFSNIDTFYL